MYFLVSGDKNNAMFIKQLMDNPASSDYILGSLYSKHSSFRQKLEQMFTEDLSKEDYIYYMYLLTLSDTAPNPLDIFTATAFYFSLEVNYATSLNHNRGKKVPTIDLAVKTAQAFDFDYNAYLESDAELSNELEDETIKVNLKFRCILNEFEFTIPVVKIKKGWLRKRDVGYRIKPGYNVYIIFAIGNDDELHRMPLAYYLRLTDEYTKGNGSYIFKDKADFNIMINRTDDNTMREVLHINGFYGVCSYDNEGNSIWVDENDDYLYVQGKNPPVFNGYDEESIPAGWERLRDGLFRAFMDSNKFYISYISHNRIILLSC